MGFENQIVIRNEKCNTLHLEKLIIMTKSEKANLIMWCIDSLSKRPQMNTNYSLYKIKHFAGTSIKTYVTLEDMHNALELIGYKVVVKKDRLISNAYIKKPKVEGKGMAVMCGKMR